LELRSKQPILVINSREHHNDRQNRSIFPGAYWQPGMTSVYTEKVTKELMASDVNKDGWYEWKLLPGTLTAEDYKQLGAQYNVVFPDIFIEWHRRYYFADGDCSIVRLPRSFPNRPLEEISDWHFNLGYSELLISNGLIPFADDGNDVGSFVFDTRNAEGQTDFPIRLFDHEFDDLDGLSEVIFSSFEKLLECVTHYLIEEKKRKRHEIFPDFFEIDPEGAGGEGRAYWLGIAEMYEEN
jgi:hypothetical protein